MAKTQQLTATLPSGEIVTRRTARTYSHVVASKTTYTDGTCSGWHTHGWCGRPELAQKQVAKLLGSCTAGSEVPVSWSSQGGWVTKTVASYDVQAVPVGV